jgi:hypothetical protein
LAKIQSQIAQQFRTQSESHRLQQLEISQISQNIAKLNNSVIALTAKMSHSSSVKNGLQKSILRPHSMIGFKPNLITFQAVPAASSLLDGFISYLTTRHRDNVHDCGIVNIFAHRVYDGGADNATKNVADLNTDSYFHSANETNQFIGYDFREMMQIIPTHYSLRSCNSGSNGHHWRSWVVEVSNHGQWLDVVDQMTDCRNLNDKHAVQCFAMHSPPKTEV